MHVSCECGQEERSGAVVEQVIEDSEQRRHVLLPHRGEGRDAELVASELAVGLDVDDAVRHAAPSMSRPSHRSSRRRPGWSRPASEPPASVTNGRDLVTTCGPVLQHPAGGAGAGSPPRPGRPARASTRSARPAAPGSPTAGVLRVWSLRELSMALVRERNEGIHRAVPRGEALGTLDRGGGEDAQPQPAVGGEGLLRGEVVRVGLGDVDHRAAGGRGGIDQHELIGVGPVRSSHRDHHTRSRSRCAARRRHRRPPGRQAPGARRASRR